MSVCGCVVVSLSAVVCEPVHMCMSVGGLYRQERIVKVCVYTVWRWSIFTEYVCEFTWKSVKGGDQVSE